MTKGFAQPEHKLKRMILDTWGKKLKAQSWI
jgi:hypothetical protein